MCFPASAKPRPPTTSGLLDDRNFLSLYAFPPKGEGGGGGVILFACMILQKTKIQCVVYLKYTA